MRKFQVILTEHAITDLDAVPKEFKTQIHDDIGALESAPFTSGTRIKRLRGFRPLIYRLRSGNFRVLYRIQGDTIIILRVIDRKLLERVIKRLRKEPGC